MSRSKIHRISDFKKTAAELLAKRIEEVVGHHNNLAQTVQGMQNNFTILLNKSAQQTVMLDIVIKLLMDAGLFDKQQIQDCVANYSAVISIVKFLQNVRGLK